MIDILMVRVLMQTIGIVATSTSLPVEGGEYNCLDGRCSETIITTPPPCDLLSFL